MKAVQQEEDTCSRVSREYQIFAVIEDSHSATKAGAILYKSVT
jgi:hypothetical protein